MLIIIPPATAMDMTPVSISEKPTTPVFQRQADYLANLMSHLSVAELVDKLQISEELAEAAHEEYRRFNDPAYPAKPAIFAYAGALYKTLNPKLYSPADLHYAQSHLRMISTLYGVLRPLDLIKAYRISFHIKLSEWGVDNLFDYWRDLVTGQLKMDVSSAGGEMLYLAVESMFKVVDLEVLTSKYHVVIVTFKDWHDGEWRDIRSYSKPAKAEIVNAVIRGKIEKLVDLKGWKWGGYQFNRELSSDTDWIYTRRSVI